jgi:hypothetical protein
MKQLRKISGAALVGGVILVGLLSFVQAEVQHKATFAVQ